MGQKREVLALRVAAWHSRHLRTGRIDSGLLAEQVIGNLRITNPDVHLSADGGPENAIVFIAELLHGEPWGHWVNIVDTPDIGDGARGTGEELEPRRWLVSLRILEYLDSSNEDENA